jgi:hypothetical protein
MNLILGILFIGIAIVGFYTIYLHNQLNKLSDEYEVFKQKVQKGFIDVHKDIDMVDKTMQNQIKPKQQLNG